MPGALDSSSAIQGLLEIRGLTVTYGADEPSPLTALRQDDFKLGSVRSKTDPKTVQPLLSHSDVRTTLQLYAHSVSEDRMAAQGKMLHAILQPVSAVN